MPRESRSGATAQRNRLGKILVRKEVIDQHQLEEAMHLQEREGKFLGQILVEKGWSTEEEITEAISDSLHLSIVHVKDVLLSQKIVELIPRSLAVTHHVLPLFIQNKKIYLAMENPLDIEVIREVESHTRMRVIPMIAFPSQLQQAIRRHYNMNEYVGSMLGNVEEQEADQILELDQILGEDDTTQSPAKVMYTPLLSRIKMLSGMNIADHKTPQKLPSEA